MKVSIITVCFNAAKTIEDTIRSVSSQNFKDFEYIIVDGGSKDGTEEVVNQHRDVVDKFISEPDDGIYDAYNKGINMAEGEIIGFINADDFFASDSVILKIVNEFENKNVGVVFGDLCYVKQDDPSQIVRYWKTSEYKAGKFANGWCPPHPTFYVRQDVYKGDNGKYDTRFRLAADLEMITRCLVVNKIESRYIPEVLVKMRLGGATNQSWSNIFRQNKEILEAFKKNGIESNIFSFVLGKIFSRVNQYCIRPSNG